MKREIKFRAWYPQSKAMTFSEKGSWGKWGDCEMNDSEQGLCSIMQFTGLTDKNGKEIYEGDILEMWQPVGLVNEVIWHAGALGYVSASNTFHAFANHNDVSKPQIRDAEVIGNIYENPALLK